MFEPTNGDPARRPKNGVLGKRIQEGNPGLAHDLCVGKVTYMSEACGLPHENRDAPNASCFNVLV